MPLNSSAADIDYALKDAGVAVTIGATSGFGVLRTEEIVVETPSGLQIVGQQMTLTVREGKFSGLAQDVAVTADGSSYTIRSPGKPQTDGTRKLVLVEASP